MKKNVVVILFIVIVTMSFGKVVNELYTVKVKESSIEWKGFKPTGEHYGSISISGGNLVANGNAVVTGSFTMDINSIKVLDSDSPKLEKHLKSSDFFDATKFPTAKFDISGSTKVNGKILIKGYLTIKGIRKEISFLAKISKNELGDLVLESETIKINRADFNVKYKSKTFYANLKDKFIYDEFELKVSVVLGKY